MRINVEGLAELDAALGIAAVTTTLRVAAKIQEHAGRMNEEIKRSSPSRRAAASSTVDISSRGLVAEFGPTHPLGRWFEFGTGPRVQHSTGRYTGVMSPRPFVGPVVDRGVPRFLDDVANAVGDI